MTIHEAIFSTVRQPLLGILYLLLTLQMALLIAAFRAKRSLRFRLVCLLHTLISSVCLWFPFMDIDSNPFRTDVLTALPLARSAFTALPVWTLFLYEAVTVILLAAAYRNMRRWRQGHLTSYSIKETMDLLPAGIAFGKADGTVVLSNLAMNRLSQAVAEKSLTDLNAFREAIETPAEGEEKAESQITLPDGSGVWQISSSPLQVDGEPCIQLTAADITEQAAILQELEDKNRTLRDIRMRLDIYNKQAERIIIAQELLTARMAVHSEVGNVLLESRHYLADPQSFDEDKLLRALKNTNTYLLREYERDDTARDPLTDAVEMAEAIGVDILISGPVPAEDPYRSILAAAIGECASNAVKHANGDRLSVTIRNQDAQFIFILESNGEPPQEAIRETGGLLSLRTLVENHDGMMETTVSPGFTLTIRL